MKNPVTGRDTLLSRTSPLDGTVHLNRGLRDGHDAMKQAEQARKRMEDMRKQMERMRKAGKPKF